MMKYNIGDKISHPLHGAGAISEIEVRNVSGDDIEYYIMIIPHGNMRIMIPVNSCEKIGIRPILKKKEAEDIIKNADEIEVDISLNWNKRFRENFEMIKSGDLRQVLFVLKSLAVRDGEKGLSTGERKLYSSAKQIFISEMMLSLDKNYEEIEAILQKS